MRTTAITFFCAISAVYSAPAYVEKKSSPPISSITPAQWAQLNHTVGGRLHVGYPMAKPCYSVYNGSLVAPDSALCSTVQSGYTDETYVASQYGGYMNPNWGTCQAKTQGCDLDFNLPADPLYYIAPQTCYQGSVPSYYIDVSHVSDVQAGLSFADKTGIPIIIKNSGHDYKGRSSAPNSLALWTHNLQPALKLTKNFTPEGCSKPAADGVTMGAGQGFDGLYTFAEANNITIVGGSSRTVGAAGGWISGGGHSAMSNTLGLGVDNVLQIKTVLPNGTYITANRCQNQDVFFALRGGGGSTFGVNMEMTTTANPQVELQVAYVRFLSIDLTSIDKFIAICTQNANKWAGEGWGGYIVPGAQSVLGSGLVLMTPKLNHTDAVASMKPITDYVASLGNVPLNNEIDTSHSFYQAYSQYLLPNEEKVDVSLAIASRLIPKSVFTTTSGQASVADAISKGAKMVVPLTATSKQPDLRALTYGSPYQILVTAPSSYDASKDTVPASVTPAWRDAVWHVIAGQPFTNNAKSPTINNAFKTAHDAAQLLRDVTPNSGAYQNEADVFEPNPTQSFWGQNYDRLSSLKKQIDPKNLLTCWDCVGWDSSAARYGCYPSAPS